MRIKPMSSSIKLILGIVLTFCGLVILFVIGNISVVYNVNLPKDNSLPLNLSFYKLPPSVILDYTEQQTLLGDNSNTTFVYQLKNLGNDSTSSNFRLRFNTGESPYYKDSSGKSGLLTSYFDPSYVDVPFYVDTPAHTMLPGTVFTEQITTTNIGVTNLKKSSFFGFAQERIFIHDDTYPSKLNSFRYIIKIPKKTPFDDLFGLRVSADPLYDQSYEDSEYYYYLWNFGINKDFTGNIFRINLDYEYYFKYIQTIYAFLIFVTGIIFTKLIS